MSTVLHADWEKFCRYRFSRPEVGFALDVSRVSFEPSDLTTLEGPLQQALAAMARLEQGAIANADENRMVGHYWLRAPQLAPEASLTREITETTAAVQQFAADVHSGKVAGAGGTFETVIVAGIGGSALGPQFVAQALGSANDKLRLEFADNTDPDGIDQLVARVGAGLNRAMVVVISKSGGTPETRNGMLELKAAYQARGLDFGRHAVAVTQQGSQLDQVAVRDQWLRRFPMWDWVGGRTSVMSAVGLLPAALQGIEIAAFLEGAAAMDRLTREPNVWQNPACWLAGLWFHVGQGRGLKDMVVLPYKDRLALFSKYLQQLVMESLGKEKDRSGRVVNQGLAVYGNKGSTDQHAYVQQLRDGLPNFFATFIQVLKDRTGASLEVEPGVTSGDYLQGFYLGTRQALWENSRGSITITVNDVSPQSVGMLIALYERAVGLYAELVNINAYHQPGVEAGKKAAAAVLVQQALALKVLRASHSAMTADEIAAAAGSQADPETLYHILEHWAANGAHGVQRIAGATPASERFSVS